VERGELGEDETMRETKKRKYSKKKTKNKNNILMLQKMIK
jgi:hypothetical protein